jgi:hypothetical protein
MYLSTIAISEFTIKQPITDLPLRNFRVLPFNIDDAIKCGSLIPIFTRDPEDPRAKFKDDFKIISQCCAQKISHLISEDEATLHKYVKRLHANGQHRVDVILLKNGFDRSFFDGGQLSL